MKLEVAAEAATSSFGRAPYDERSTFCFLQANLQRRRCFFRRMAELLLNVTELLNPLDFFG